MRSLLVAAALLLPAVALGGGQGIALPKEAEARFLAARDAFRAGERVRLARLVESLRGDELAPWAEHWQLRLRLEESSAEGVPEFLDREAGSYVAEKLRAEWLRQLGKAQDWQRFQQEYPSLVQPDPELVCYAQRARLVRQQDVTALDEARANLLSALELPEACQPLTEKLVADGRLSGDDLWAHMRRLLEYKKYAAAKQFSRYLPHGQAPEPRTLDAIADAPARYLARLPAGFSSGRSGREMALFAVQRMARNDPGAAATQWRTIEDRYAGADRAYAWGQIAWQGALRHMPEASAWYRLASDAVLSEEQLAWKVRAALRVLDWPTVIQTVGEMPPAMAAQPDWTYWLGRALASQGRRDEALVLYQRIAGLPNFYGSLAGEELGQPVVVPPRAAPPSSEELALAADHRGLRRALALLATDMRIEGVREWAWSLRGMDDRQLLAAAELARRHSVFDRAINTADKTLAEHDYGLRYLSPFRDQVEPRARELALDSGWVYGLMRQESRFVMDARSSAGAKGLMQLMPTTARWVAKKIGLADYHPGRVAEMETNVVLGTSYLKMVLEGLDNHPVLASAAYNAGPGRARKWRAERPLEGAIYAETIPFNETRDYVKKVMSNAVFYAALFENKPQSLKGRLGIVRPRGFNDGTVEDLP